MIDLKDEIYKILAGLYGNEYDLDEITRDSLIDIFQCILRMGELLKKKNN